MKNERIQDLVSIITPVYNAERVIERTIRSVQEQSYTRWEMLLIDDCSTDGSAALIERISSANAQIRYIRLERNSGAAVARNCGLKEARGRFVAFLDADDYWQSNKLQRCLDLMRERECAFVYTATQMIDEDDRPLGNYTPVPVWTDYSHLLKRTVIATSTVVIDMERMGEFEMPLRRSGQDYATWLMLLRRVERAYGIDEPLSLYRISRNSLSSNKLKSIRQVFEIQTRTEGLNPVYAAWNTFFFCLYAFKKHFMK